MKVLFKNGKTVRVSRKVARSIFKTIDSTNDIDKLGLTLLRDHFNDPVFECDLREIIAIY